MKVIEIQGVSHVFNLADGTSLRLFSRQTKEISVSQVSDELKLAEKLGLVILEAPIKKGVSE